MLVGAETRQEPKLDETKWHSKVMEKKSRFAVQTRYHGGFVIGLLDTAVHSRHFGGVKITRGGQGTQRNQRIGGTGTLCKRQAAVVEFGAHQILCEPIWYGRRDSVVLRG